MEPTNTTTPMPPMHPPGRAPTSRRAMIAGALALAGSPWSRAAPLSPAMAASIEFPRDFGSHPATRTEWWYITGHASQGERQFGFQITFFRSRVGASQALESRFAARQLVFAHAAVTDLQGGRLLHDQRIARWSGLPAGQDGFDQAFAGESDTDLRLGSGRDAWTLKRLRDGYRARAVASGFALDIDLMTTQPPLLQGDLGLSRKGPLPGQVSRYYSVPQLRARSGISLDGQRILFDTPARGRNAAWLDHEWSDEFLPAGAVGWDWMGINCFDGSALTVFRLRRGEGEGGGALFGGGSFRSSGNAAVRVFADGEVRFEVIRWWTSGRTQARYPVELRVGTPAGDFSLHALLDDQELDSRGSTGAVYWEGLSELRDAEGMAVGRGYLELTGYQSALRL